MRTPPCVYVSAKTPFMAVVKRVRKALENSGGGHPRSTRGLPLTARVAALSTGGRTSSGRQSDESEVSDDGSSNKAADDEVVILGSGRAIEKTLNVAAWFQRQTDCRVSLRTRSVAAIDDIVLGRAQEMHDKGEAAEGDDADAEVEADDADGEQEDDDDAEDHARVRMVSCLEVAVRLR